MKPVGKYAANVVNLAARRMLMQQLQASKDKLDGKETAEETAARDERQRQRLFILDKLREAMAKAGFVLHQDDPTYVWTERTDECIELEDLKERLGYGIPF